MKSKLINLSERVAKANDQFSSKFESIDTLMGIMDRTLRNKGMAADAITIDCKSQNKKIVLVIHDAKPDVVEIALGNKAGHIYSSSEYAYNEVSAAVIVDIMATNFLPQ
ncbi:MAG: hypothetical protein HRT53_16360 [Colwellia sp.]|nr:hypothetical protein [Colwellia sp.]